MVVVGAGPAGLATAIRLKQLVRRARQGILGLHRRKGLGSRRPHPVRRGDRPARARRALPRLEGEGRAAQPAGDRGPLPVPHRRRRVQGPRLDAAGLLQEPRQLHREPRQPLPLAGPAGRGARRRDLSGLRRRRSALRRATARCAAWPPATWASARTARRPRATSPASSCTRSTRSSPKAAAATSASRCRRASSCARAWRRRSTASA